MNKNNDGVKNIRSALQQAQSEADKWQKENPGKQLPRTLQNNLLLAEKLEEEIN